MVKTFSILINEVKLIKMKMNVMELNLNILNVTVELNLVRLKQFVFKLMDQPVEQIPAIPT